MGEEFDDCMKTLAVMYAELRALYEGPKLAAAQGMAARRALMIEYRGRLELMAISLGMMHGLAGLLVEPSTSSGEPPAKSANKFA